MAGRTKLASAALILLLGRTVSTEVRAEASIDLAADYRSQIHQYELAKNPEYPNPIIAYSDPAAVVVTPAQPGARSEQMGAVVIRYTPFKAVSDSPVAVVTTNVALFQSGHLLRMSVLDNPLLSWPAGRPEPHSDIAADRAREAGWSLTEAEQFHDPGQRGKLLRRYRLGLWFDFGDPLTELYGATSPSTARVLTLLVAEKTSRLEAQYAAAHAGVDPFSAEMNLRITTANVAAHQRLVAEVTEPVLEKLEFRRKVISQAKAIQLEVGDDLDDAGVPFTADQLTALGTSKARGDDAVALHATAVRVLHPGQIPVYERYYRDHELSQQRYRDGPRPFDPSRAMDDPVYGPLFRRQTRRTVLKKYGLAIAELSLPTGQTAQLKDLLVERALAPFEANALARKQGAERATSAEIKEARAKVNAEIQSLLGAEGQERLEDISGRETFGRTLSVLPIAALGSQGMPLSDTQKIKLANATWLVRSREKNPRVNAMRQDIDPATNLNGQDRAVMKLAAEFLSAAQEEALGIYFADSRADRG